jgi:hypothetical protein
MEFGIYTAVFCLGLGACYVAIGQRDMIGESAWRRTAAVGVWLALAGFIGIVWEAL